MCPRLVRKGVLRWRDLVVAGVVHLEHLEIIVYTHKMAYDMGLQDVRLQSMAPDDGARGLALDRWGASWGRQRTLLYMQSHTAEPPRHTPDVWQLFNCLYLPQWDLDFIRRVLWKKITHGGAHGPPCGE